MPDTTNGAAGVTYTEISRELLFGSNGNASETTDLSLEEFTNLPPTITSANLENPLFDFGVSIINAADESFDDFVDDLAAVTSAALEVLSNFIIGADGANIDVAVTINPDLGPGTVASATAGSFFTGAEDENGFVEVFTSAQLELQTGTDFNGETPDIIINVNPEFLLGASFDTDPDRVAIPGVTDFVSVLIHEITHSLGFLSFRDNTGEDFTLDLDGDGDLETLDSTYGSFVEFNEVDGLLTPTFNGATAVEVYGEAITLESTFDSAGSDVSHFALFNPDGSVADTALALENPSVIPGDIVTVGALELAVFEDLGYNVATPDNIGLVNTLDGLPFTPTVSVNQQLTADGDTVLLTLQFDAPSLFTTLPSSVGVTVLDADGAEQTLRADFAPGATSVTIELDANEFFDTSGPADFTSVSGDVDVTLFFPAQANLGNGEQTETISVSANLISGSDAGDDIDGGNRGDQLFGGAGDDNIDGNNGSDFIGAGEDNDIVNGGNGNDTVLGDNGDDEINGGNGFDLLFGGDGNDTISGSNDRDTISGGAGDDQLTGGNGRDVIDAGAGSDTLEGGNGIDILFGGAGSDVIIGGNGHDRIDAGDDADTVESGNGNDVIFGGSGDDNITAGNGRDSITGGAGNDTLEGGTGSDDFIFSFGTADDVDTILDFARNDTLVLDGFGDFETVDDVLAAASQVGDSVFITLDAATNQILELEDFDLDDLQASNIEFGTGPDALDPFQTFVANDILSLV